MNNLFSFVASFQYGALLRAALAWFWALPWWGEILVVAAAGYSGYVLVLAIARTILLVIDQLMRWALQFIHWFSSMLSTGILAALRALGRGVMILLGLLSWPFLWAGWQIKAAISGAVSNLQDRLYEEKELRQLWDREFRDQFKRFKDFKEAFNQGHGPEPKGREEPHFGGSDFEKQRNPPDPFVEACRLFGLAENGEFSEKDLERKYRKFIKAVHPDNDGSDTLAAQINKARDIIKQRKVWA